MEKVFLKYLNMYITNIYANEEYPENEFIAKLELHCSKEYVDTYSDDKLPFLIQKLDAIGLDRDLMHIEKIEKEN